MYNYTRYMIQYDDRIPILLISTSYFEQIHVIDIWQENENREK